MLITFSHQKLIYTVQQRDKIVRGTIGREEELNALAITTITPEENAENYTYRAGMIMRIFRTSFGNMNIPPLSRQQFYVRRFDTRNFAIRPVWDIEQEVGGQWTDIANDAILKG